MLMCNGLDETLPWYQFQTWNLDRSVSQCISPGYFVLSVDKTAFSVNHPLWLEQFDVSKIFNYDPVKEIISENVTVKYEIVEILKEVAHEEIIFKGEIILNSTYEAEAKTQFSGMGISLKPGYTYEIQVEIPEGKQLMYFEDLEIKEFDKRRFLQKSIHVKFHQANLDSKPPTEGYKTRKLSQGIVKQLHLKYAKV